MATLVVPARFNGPPDSGNGGWSAGSLAALLLPADDVAPVSVRLHRPVPLDVPLDVDVTGSAGARAAVASSGGEVVMTAVEVGPDALPSPVPPVDAETALAAQSRYRGASRHPFPTCFACGPERAPGDGLGLRPGTLLWREDVTACPWTPDPGLDAGDGSAPLPAVWAAVDCPGGWSLDLVGRPAVLGSITAVVWRRPSVGEECVVTGAALGTSGRKALTATSLYGADGQLLARAGHIWIQSTPS